MKTSFTSHSQKETKDFAKNLAAAFLTKPFRRKGAFVLGLEGELGAGKTSFAQGFAQGLGIKEKILSPTFVILKKYAVSKSRAKSQKSSSAFFYHIDCYRLHKPAELLALGFKKIVSNPDNIVLIEWADHIRKILPQNSWRIVFILQGPATRRLSLHRGRIHPRPRFFFVWYNTNSLGTKSQGAD